MRTRTPTPLPRRALTGAALAALLLAACSDAGELSSPPTPVITPEVTTTPPDTTPTSAPPDAAPTTAQPTPPTVTTAPPEDTRTTTAPPAADEPALPPVADERSFEGALAYAETYLNTVGYRVQYPVPGALSSFATGPECTLCRAWVDENQRRVDERIRGDRIGLTLGATEGSLDEQGAVLRIAVDQPEISMVDDLGAVDSTIPASRGHFFLEMDWTDESWTITSLQFQPES